MKSYGVAVIGMGIAGKVRVRDLVTYKTEHKDAHLVGYTTRQELNIDGATRLKDDPFANPDVEIVIVATENQRHEEIAKKALMAKKHVIVEYPLARSFAAAEQLHQLAITNGVLCHEECISMLLESTKSLKHQISGKQLESAEYTFIASSGHKWCLDFSASGSPFICNVNIFQLLVELFGNLSAVNSTIQISEGYLKANAELRTEADKTVKVCIERAPGQSRMKKIHFKFSDGSAINQYPQDQRTTPGLFYKDFQLFMEMVNGNTELYNKWKERSLKAIKLAEHLTNMATLK